MSEVQQICPQCDSPTTGGECETCQVATAAMLRIRAGRTKRPWSKVQGSMVQSQGHLRGLPVGDRE
jgi:hypothetical protein